MPRDIPVSNGNLLVAFDLDYRIRDIFYPRIGQENHTRGQEFRFGVWADGHFSWMGPEWSKDLRYRDDGLVTDVRLTNEALGLELRCNDAIDIQLNVFVRKIEVRDLSGACRDVRLFFNHDFHLYGHEIGDTAFFDPPTHSIIHYKVSRYFLANCRAAGSEHGDYYSCGTKESAATQPSWKDAEDGELVGTAIAWGLAESTVGARLAVPANETATAYYWLAAGKDYKEVAGLNQQVVDRTPAALLDRTFQYWRVWVHRNPRDFAGLPQGVRDVFDRSLLILRSQIDNRGAIIAANDSDIVRFGGDTYSYMWGRDGAFVAAALARAGYPELCQKFFNFCSPSLAERGYLFQHYNPDGSLASNWHAWLLDGEEVLPIQEDSTALILWALWIYYECSKDIDLVRSLYDDVIVKSAGFLLQFRDSESLLPNPCYDLWEERYGVHAYTVASVIAGLRAAARFAEVFKEGERAATYNFAADQMAAGIDQYLFDSGHARFARSGYRTDGGYELDQVVDVSLLGLATLGVVSPADPRMVETARVIREELTCLTATGGLARYKNDQYQRGGGTPDDVPGNPWFIATLWLCEYEISASSTVAELRRAVPHLEWCATNALPSGVLAEQVDPITGVPLSVSPLTWSHSAFVWAVLAYAEKYDALLAGDSGKSQQPPEAAVSGLR